MKITDPEEGRLHPELGLTRQALSSCPGRKEMPIFTLRYPMAQREFIIVSDGAD